MGRSQESFGKKNVRSKKEKKRKEKAKKREAKRDEKPNSLDDMIAYVDEYGNITDTPPDPEEKEEVDIEDVQIGAANRNDADNDEDIVRTGTITYFNDEKGFGFIKDAQTKEDIFVHINNSEDELKEGNKVSFEIEMGPKGPAAYKVKIEK